jgi:hypothetical protein
MFTGTVFLPLPHFELPFTERTQLRAPSRSDSLMSNESVVKEAPRWGVVFTCTQM